MKIIKTNQGETVTGGLAGLVSTFLGAGLNKRQQLSNWEMRPLSEKQIIYGACDAIVLLDIYNRLCQLNHPTVKNLPKLSL
jgi:ribonuclease D